MPSLPSLALSRSKVLLSLLLVGLLLSLAAPALAAPPQTRSFGSAIDPYARYERPSQCQAQEQRGVAYFRDLVMRAYPNTGRGNIVRMCGSSSATSHHHEGRAWDWMVNAGNATERAQADELLAWLLATDAHGNRHAMARRFGISYIIWNRRIWKAWDAGRGWQSYTGSHPHTDHVHFSFGWPGARQQTTYWTAPQVAAQPAHDGTFPDVHPSSMFGPAVEWAADEGVASGRANGLFEPYGEVSRAQAVTFLWRWMGKPQASLPHGFTDVPDGAYYEDAVAWAREAGITTGTTATSFQPHRTVNRGQITSMLWRMAGSPDGYEPGGFRDVEDDAHYADGVGWMVAHGVTTGRDEHTFAPLNAVTRGQTALFLHRLIQRPAAWDSADYRPASVQN